MYNVFFSICIPAYKNAGHLQRLLESIFQQTFTDYEIIITDDTEDDSLHSMILERFSDKGIFYIKNNHSVGTPENWNVAISYAKGKWVKLMHNDDWFTNQYALQTFYDAIQANPGINFFFTSFINIIEKNGHRMHVRMNWFDRLFLNITPLHLFRKVYIGNPSCTAVLNGLEITYNRNFKFVVDFDYYIRLIQAGNKYKYIDKYLINIGFHEEQVTKYTKFNPSVQIYENLTLLEQYGPKILNNIFVFDYYWRLLRNIGVNKESEIKRFFNRDIPDPIKKMLKWQYTIKLKTLKIGVFSKFFMILTYIQFRLKI